MDVGRQHGAALFVVLQRGNQGGIELGFNYRTRLSGLDADEAEALDVLLNAQSNPVIDLGMGDAARRAVRKLIESFPDTTRQRTRSAQQQFRFDGMNSKPADEQLLALLKAVRQRNMVRINANTTQVATVHPVALVWCDDAWHLANAAQDGKLIPLAQCGDINISAKYF